MNIRRLRARLERIEAQANSLSRAADILCTTPLLDWSNLENHPLKESIEAWGRVADEHEPKLDRERRK